MSKPKALVLSGDGINCDRETAWAVNCGGFESTVKHVSSLLENSKLLDDYQLLCIPGGFSFGDEIASGKVLAIKLSERLSDSLNKFIERKMLVLGICNGFQVLTQMGLLPSSAAGTSKLVSLMPNKGGTFINRWVKLKVGASPAKESFFAGLSEIELPIRHGEGRLSLEPGADSSEQVKKHGALRYEEDVNGSFDHIAALSNASGNVLGLMPHPEAFVRITQHPNWTDRAQTADPHGLAIFRNAAKFAGAR